MEPADQIQVIDGDTVRLGAQRIQLKGFDAPEADNTVCEVEKDRGVKAMVRLQQLLAAGRAELLLEAKHDRHGRTLGRLLVDGQDVAVVMVREGLAAAGEETERDWCHTERLPADGARPTR